MNIKKIVCIILVIAFCIALCGCNRQAFDTTYNFNYAYIQLPNGECIEGKVSSWTDFEDGDQLQVKMDDGTTYLTHSSNVVLVHK